MALGVIGIGLLGYVAHALVKFIISHHLDFLARQAVEFAEYDYKHLHVDTKINYACEWVSARLKHYRIKIDEEEIEGVSRSAYIRFKKDAEKELKEA